MLGKKTFESTLIILSRLQQEKDEDLEMQELLDHSAKKTDKLMQASYSVLPKQMYRKRYMLLVAFSFIDI